jgi:hypothetical protein
MGYEAHERSSAPGMIPEAIRNPKASVPIEYPYSLDYFSENTYTPCEE